MSGRPAPLDQFRAFQRSTTGHERGRNCRPALCDADHREAATSLASVLPKLHELYADDGMTLEQLMAFSVTADHARQDQIWEQVSRSGYDEPYQIRRMLTENGPRV